MGTGQASARATHAELDDELALANEAETGVFARSGENMAGTQGEGRSVLDRKRCLWGWAWPGREGGGRAGWTR